MIGNILTQFPFIDYFLHWFWIKVSSCIFSKLLYTIFLRVLQMVLSIVVTCWVLWVQKFMITLIYVEFWFLDVPLCWTSFLFLLISLLSCCLYGKGKQSKWAYGIWSHLWMHLRCSTYGFNGGLLFVTRIIMDFDCL